MAKTGRNDSTIHFYSRLQDEGYESRRAANVDGLNSDWPRMVSEVSASIVNPRILIEYSRFGVPDYLDNPTVHGFVVLCNSLNRVPKSPCLRAANKNQNVS